MYILRYFLMLFLVTNLFAKEKNIFFDVNFEVPLFGIGTFNDGYGSTEDEYFSPFFLGLGLGYTFNINDDWAVEPSVGYSFNTDTRIPDIGNETFRYNYSNITLPIMYKKKGFKGGVFFKQMYIDSIKWGEDYRIGYIEDTLVGVDNRLEFKDKHPFTLGIKVVTKSWFYSYEYLFDGKYTTDNGRAKIDLEGSRISIGIRNTF